MLGCRQYVDPTYYRVIFKTLLHHWNRKVEKSFWKKLPEYCVFVDQSIQVNFLWKYCFRSLSSLFCSVWFCLSVHFAERAVHIHSYLSEQISDDGREPIKTKAEPTLTPALLRRKSSEPWNFDFTIIQCPPTQLALVP